MPSFSEQHPRESRIRIVVGVTGASGSVYGWRLLEKLRSREDAEIHLILTRSGERTAFLEMGKNSADFKALADCSYPVEDIGCRLASGSFETAASKHQLLKLRVFCLR